MYQQLLRALAKLDRYLREPLEHELAQEPQLRESRRRFLDGDQLTLADCCLLPKLHTVDVSWGCRWRESGGRAREVPVQTLTGPRTSPRRPCARTFDGRPSPQSCAGSAATWTAPYRRRSSDTLAHTALRS